MKDRPEYVREWLLKAESDMKIASRESAVEDPASDAVCFHFQQFVEKMLKAWLIANEVDYQPTHNIEILLVACEKLDSSFGELRGIEKLTPYAVEIRYADDFYFPTRDEMQEAARMARNTGEFVQGKLREIGIDPEIRR